MMNLVFLGLAAVISAQISVDNYRSGYENNSSTSVNDTGSDAGIIGPAVGMMAPMIPPIKGRRGKGLYGKRWYGKRWYRSTPYS
jgi:hypothetical protein